LPGRRTRSRPPNVCCAPAPGKHADRRRTTPQERGVSDTSVCGSSGVARDGVADRHRQRGVGLRTAARRTATGRGSADGSGFWPCRVVSWRAAWFGRESACCDSEFGPGRPSAPWSQKSGRCRS
jgi:hypothetical protein